jgi:hypothetical protein
VTRATHSSALAFVIGVCLQSPCANPTESRADSAVPPLTAELKSHSAELDRAKLRALQLAVRWEETGAKFERAAGEYRDLEKVLSDSIARWHAAQNEWEHAADRSKSAVQLWEIYQVLVVIATTVDAANLDRHQAHGNVPRRAFDCSQSMSNAAYRRRLEAEGFNWEGHDVGHIVPLSLGGARHPANMMPMDSSLNRSLGNTWSMPICASFWGSAVCRSAVAVSKQCGTF